MSAYLNALMEEGSRETLLAEIAKLHAQSRHFRVHVDCWYEAYRDPGKKQKPPERVRVHVIVAAADNESAIKVATEWADKTAPGSKGRKLISIEHRSTGPVKFPMEVQP